MTYKIRKARNVLEGFEPLNANKGPTSGRYDGHLPKEEPEKVKFDDTKQKELDRRTSRWHHRGYSPASQPNNGIALRINHVGQLGVKK